MSGGLVHMHKNIDLKLTFRRILLLTLVAIMGFSLAEPGVTYALAESNKDRPIKSDYTRVKPLDIKDSSQKIVVGAA